MNILPIHNNISPQTFKATNKVEEPKKETNNKTKVVVYSSMAALATIGAAIYLLKTKGKNGQPPKKIKPNDIKDKTDDIPKIKDDIIIPTSTSIEEVNKKIHEFNNKMKNLLDEGNQVIKEMETIYRTEGIMYYTR